MKRLTISGRGEFTKAAATRYARSSRAQKKINLDELCSSTGWRRDYARRAVRQRLLLKIAPATTDRCFRGDRAKLSPWGRSHTKPGFLVKDSILMRNWAEGNNILPGFVEIDLVGHEGGNNSGEFCCTLDITGIATGRTETHSVTNKAQKWVLTAF